MAHNVLLGSVDDIGVTVAAGDVVLTSLSRTPERLVRRPGRLMVDARIP